MRAMRYRTILFWTLMLALLGGACLSAQCPTSAVPGQFISFPLTATVPSSTPATSLFWLVSPSFMTANPAQGNPTTTISGTIPANAVNGVTIQATYNQPEASAPLYSFSCFIQIVTQQPLQINGSCPSTTYHPGDIISIPFTASGGNTKQYVWSVNTPFFVSPPTGP